MTGAEQHDSHVRRGAWDRADQQDLSVHALATLHRNCTHPHRTTEHLRIRGWIGSLSFDRCLHCGTTFATETGITP